MENKEDTTSKSGFLKHKFNGDPTMWNLFHSEVITALHGQKSCGSNAEFYLDTIWPNDPVTNKLIFETRYVMSIVPEPYGEDEGKTPAQERDRINKIIFLEKRNENLQELFSGTWKIITDRLSESIKTGANEYKGNSYNLWTYLKSTFGQQNLTTVGKGNILINLFAYTMDNKERFTEWISKFNDKCTTCDVSIDQKLAIMTTDGKNDLKIQCLPDRLQKSVTKVREDQLSWADAVRYLTERDQEQHTHNTVGPSTKKIIRLVKESTHQCNSCEEKWKCISKCLCNDQPTSGYRSDVSGSSRTSQRGDGQYNRGGRGFGGRGGRNGGRFNTNQGRGQNNYTNYDPNYGSNYGGKTQQRDFRPNNNSYNSNSSGKPGSKQVNFKSENVNSNNPKNNKRPNKRIRLVDGTEIDNDDEDEEQFNDYYEPYSEEYDNNYPRDNSENDDDEVDERTSRYNYNANIRIVKRLDINQNVRTNITFKPRGIIAKVSASSNMTMLADSGADEHCVQSTAILHNIVTYNEQNRAPLQLAGAGGDDLPVIARGDVNSLVKNAYVVDKLDVNILSTNRAREEGLYFVQPPTDMFPNHAGFFLDKDWTLVGVCDKDLMTNVSDWSSYNVKLNVPDLSPIARVLNPQRRVNMIYGFSKELSVAERVSFVTRSLMMSQSDLEFLTIGMINFPLDQMQIRKHYKKPEALVQGQMQARSKKWPGIVQDDIESIAVSAPLKNPHRMLEQRNLTIGAVVGTDVFGPFQNKCASQFVDKASGFVKSWFFNWSSKKQVSFKYAQDNGQVDEKQAHAVVKTVEHIFDVYKSYGHGIKVLQSDSFSAYKSKTISDFILTQHAKQQISTPGQHEGNGLSEAYVKHISNLVTAMLIAAPHFPLQHWNRAWDQAELISNLKKSRIPGSNVTRWEEFTHERPDFDLMPILPFGEPVLYLHASEFRKTLATHGRKGMYVGPDLRKKGTIIVWNPVTLCFAEAISTYSILSTVPHEWIRPDPSSFPAAAPLTTVPHDVLVNGPVHAGATQLETVTEDTPVDPVTAPVKEVSDMSVSEGVPTSHVVPSASDVSTNSSNVSVSEGVPTSHVVPSASDVSTNSSNVSVSEGVFDVDLNVSEGVSATHTDTLTRLSTRERRLPERFRPQSSEGGIARSLTPADKDKARMKFRKALHKIRVREQKAEQRDKLEIRMEDGDLIANVKLLNSKFEVVKVSNMRVKLGHDYETREQIMRIRRVNKSQKRLKERSFDNPTMKVAMARSDWPMWEAAIKDELDQMLVDKVFDNNSYTYDQLPDRYNLVGSMFVLQIKRDKATGSIDKYKARLVALGNQQRESSYDEIIR